MAAWLVAVQPTTQTRLASKPNQTGISVPFTARCTINDRAKVKTNDVGHACLNKTRSMPRDNI